MQLEGMGWSSFKNSTDSSSPKHNCCVRFDDSCQTFEVVSMNHRGFSILNIQFRNKKSIPVMTRCAAQRSTQAKRI